MNTFGYNGLIQLGGLLLDKLFSDKSARAATGASGLWTVRLGNEGETKTCVFLRLLSCGLDFAPAAVSDVSIGCYFPFQFKVFIKASDAGVSWTRKDITLGQVNIETIVLGVSSLALAKSGDQITPGFAALTTEDINLYMPIEDRLGYPWTYLLPVPDGYLTTETGVDAVTLKTKILETIQSSDLSGSGLPVPTSALVSALGTDEIAGWDFKLLSVNLPADGVDGLDLLLSKSAGGGQGLRDEAANTFLPPDVDRPDYHFAINLSGSVMLDFIEKTLVEQGYYKQGDQLNTSNNPLGYMVVPSTEPMTYYLPAPNAPMEGDPKEVTVSLPVDGNAHLIVPAGGFSAHSRGILCNITQNIKTDTFTAHSDGAADIKIKAREGDRLAVEVMALSNPDHTDVVVWKPKVELRDGMFRLRFHFYKYGGKSCDVEGDARCDLGVKPDRNTATDVETYLIDTSVSFPWYDEIWIWFLYEIPRMLAIEKITENVLKRFNFPAITGDGTMKMFLEKIDIKANGMEICCYADVDKITGSDRKQIFPPADSTPIRVSVSRFSTDVRRSGRDVVLDLFMTHATDAHDSSGVNAEVAFWSAGFNDRPAQEQFTKASLTIREGRTMFFWTEASFGACRKVLARWSNYTLEIVVIEYAQPPVLLAKIVDDIQVIPVDNPLGVPDLFSYFRYEGTIHLETEGYFRAKESREADLEHWLWDGMEVPLSGSLPIQGGTIQWDLAGDRLVLSIDQTGMVESPLDPDSASSSTHSVEFRGEDIYGQSMHAKHYLSLPASVFYLPEPPTLYPVSALVPWPIPEELQGIADIISKGELIKASRNLPQASRLVGLVGNHPVASRALQKLVEAMTTGKAELNARQGQFLLSSLIQAGQNVAGNGGRNVT
jgi:hypothetical protein